jgi:hypothetical protein
MTAKRVYPEDESGSFTSTMFQRANIVRRDVVMIFLTMLGQSGRRG